MNKQKREVNAKGSALQHVYSYLVERFAKKKKKTLLWNNALHKYPAKRILNRYLISTVIWEGWLNTAEPLM